MDCVDVDRKRAALPTSWSGESRERLVALAESDSWTGSLSAEDVQRLLDETGLDIDALMVALLPFAALYAKPVISNFSVGAVSLGESGALYYGSNMEFLHEALSFTVHAEQSATINAWVHGETGLLKLSVDAAPCGYCRQFLYELITAKALQIVLPVKDSAPSVQPLTDLLPGAFGPADLGLDGGLLEPESHEMTLPGCSDPVIDAALASANRSYAPYSSSYSGVSMSTKDGRIFSASYAENAAFNPSMSPLEAAVSYLNMCGKLSEDVQRAILVELAGAEVSQIEATRDVLRAFAPAVELETYSARPSSLERLARVAVGQRRWG